MTFEYHRKVCLAADRLPIGDMQVARCPDGQMGQSVACSSNEHDVLGAAQKIELDRMLDCQDRILDEVVVETKNVP